MPKVVLPTADLLKDFAHLERMFDFYEDGLRGLVRDMVLTADAVDTPSSRVEDAFKQALQNTGLIEKVMRDYAHSADARFNFLTGTGSEQIEVEIAVEHIYQIVLEMMAQLFRRAVYEICKQEWQWLGDDLVAKVDVLDSGVGQDDA